MAANISQAAKSDNIDDVPGIHVPRPEIMVDAFVLKPLQDNGAAYSIASRNRPELRRSVAHDGAKCTKAGTVSHVGAVSVTCSWRPNDG